MTMNAGIHVQESGTVRVTKPGSITSQACIEISMNRSPMASYVNVFAPGDPATAVKFLDELIAGAGELRDAILKKMAF